MSDALDRYIRAGEGISIEFKRCGSQPRQDTFETHLLVRQPTGW